MKRAFISVISLRILASEVCICYNRAFARIHFSFMDCHAVQAPLAMTEKGLLQKAYFTSYDSKGCGGALRALKKFRVGVTLAVMTALNFFNGVNCSPKTESPTPLESTFRLNAIL